MTDVHNGPSINQRTVVHFRCLTLTFILGVSENMISDKNNSCAEWPVDQQTDRSPLSSFKTGIIMLMPSTGSRTIGLG